MQNHISFEDNYNCNKENCIELRKQYTIRSKEHEIYTISMNKIALNPFDDKRYIIKPEGIDTGATAIFAGAPVIAVLRRKMLGVTLDRTLSCIYAHDCFPCWECLGP